MPPRSFFQRSYRGLLLGRSRGAGAAARATASAIAAVSAITAISTVATITAVATMASLSAVAAVAAVVTVMATSGEVTAGQESDSRDIEVLSVRNATLPSGVEGELSAHGAEEIM